MKNFKNTKIFAIAIALISVFSINKAVIIPLRKLVSDMQDYKFGKKPQRTPLLFAQADEKLKSRRYRRRDRSRDLACL